MYSSREGEPLIYSKKRRNSTLELLSRGFPSLLSGEKHLALNGWGRDKSVRFACAKSCKKSPTRNVRKNADELGIKQTPRQFR
jgi:hypothetical protein